MLKVNGNNTAAHKDYLIKWDTNLKIGAEAARITRYSQTKMDKEGVSPEEVFPTIKDWLDNADYIVGHNVLGFDIYLIKALYLVIYTVNMIILTLLHLIWFPVLLEKYMKQRKII